MTELEKARKNLFEEIDYTKIIDEAREELERHHDFMQSFYDKDYDTFKAQVGPEQLFKEAETILFLFNAIINYLPTRKEAYVQYTAAIRILGKLMGGNFSKREKTKCEMIEAVLGTSVMSISDERRGARYGD